MTMQTPSIYRAFHMPTGKFMSVGALTVDDRFLVSDGPEKLVALEGIRIEFFTGRISNNGQAVYQNDQVKFGVLNEFGSMAIKEGIVRYDNRSMAHYLDIPESTPLGEVHGTISIIEVIGHAI